MTDKIALVTGGARGLGRTIALALAREGCDVVVSDLSPSGRAESTTRWPAPTNSRPPPPRCAPAVAARSRSFADVTKADDVERMVAAAVETMGGLDILIANAGIVAAAPVVAMDEALWDRIFAVNVRGVFLCARAAIPHLVARGGGRIVNIASVAGKTGRAGLSAYCASKAAVISFTQSLAEELGPAGVAVNALCPGFIKTAMWTEVLTPMLAAMTGLPVERVFEEFIARSTFTKREQTPEEIAEAALFLCRAENVTGTR